MQTTLEVRWFLKGIPPAAVQHWFKFEYTGGLLTPEAEIRKDLYASGNLDGYVARFKEFTPNLTKEAINLKFREGNLELKLREEQFGIESFANKYDCSIWSGRVEQWCKLPQDLEAGFVEQIDIDWIPVYKKRWQKSNRGVEGELTQLEINGCAWWSIAFEMRLERNDVRAESQFHEVVEQAAKTYRGPELLAANSCGYVHWPHGVTKNLKVR